MKEQQDGPKEKLEDICKEVDSIVIQGNEINAEEVLGEVNLDSASILADRYMDFIGKYEFMKREYFSERKNITDEICAREKYGTGIKRINWKYSVGILAISISTGALADTYFGPFFYALAGTYVGTTIGGAIALAKELLNYRKRKKVSGEMLESSLKKLDSTYNAKKEEIISSTSEVL